MKWHVHILLMTALTYIGETIQLPFHLLEQQQAATASTTCHMKGQQCPYEHEHSGKPSAHDGKGCCNPTANCTNCPLCYTAEVTATYTSAGLSATVRHPYREIPGQPLTDYAASTWKPPNA
ncbi:hypothetical protein Q4E93_32205 [Flavitalea sp. BT771]|uniref:hypothetical protein n=1 Tax=Flavitalea sp. BT771 TaxID=3063329 RepID=UPI0026E46CBF|nr:hypothetical protein [Flavitalea sp. BT771]MDO6435324.1 hypothetical protein [Flavitalea sp. BT771]MDV6224316.1 hypothetical protein [Flavitalea sp. BT771]